MKKVYFVVLLMWLISSHFYAMAVSNLKNAIKQKNYDGVTFCLTYYGRKHLKDYELHFASHLGDNNIVELLILFDKDAIHTADKNGMIPLHWGAAKGNYNVVWQLITNGSNVNQKDYTGMTPLDRAISCGCCDIVDLLIKYGVNVNQKDDTGMTPLNRAISFGHRDIVDLLIKNGANVNQEDNTGMTPLHNAAKQGLTAIVHSLLNNNANPTIYNKSGRRAVDRVDQNSQQEIKKVLNEAITKYRINALWTLIPHFNPKENKKYMLNKMKICTSQGNPVPTIPFDLVKEIMYFVDPELWKQELLRRQSMCGKNLLKNQPDRK